jgi:integrase
MWDGYLMKPTGAHPDKALSASMVRNATKPGRFADGNGLYLIVDPTGAKRWVLRTVVQGRRRDIGLGGFKVVSLADARELAAGFRRIARDGGDPLAQRRQAQAVKPTFEEAATTVHSEQEAGWRNAKHAAQWLSTLREYAFPVIGQRRVDQIETPDLLKVLSPVWLTKPETARRVRQRIATVFDWAKAAGHRSGDNPVDGVAKGLPKQNDRTAHMTALPYGDAPAFIERLRDCDGGELVRLAFEYLILTVTRTGEVLGARWPEINLDAAVWTIPADRMKGGREHRVPLAPRCVEILHRVRELAPDRELVFPGRTADKPLSNMVFLMTLRRMEVECTAHGFRSSFRDWASERTNFPNEVCEMALAHAVKSKVEAAYRRGDLFEKRRQLMTAWAEYVAPSGAKVIALRA